MLHNTLTAHVAQSIPRSIISLVTVVLGSLYFALMSQIAVYIPYSPILMTLQTFAIFTMAGTIGSRQTFLSVLLYLVEGTCGLPVFASGAILPFWMLTPKAGFYVGFAFFGFISGWLLERKQEWSLSYIAFSLICGQLVLYAFGVAWLATFLGLKQAIVAGVLPFLPGAAIKLVAATSFLKGVHITKKQIS